MSFASAQNIMRPTLPAHVALTKYDLLRLDANTFQFRPHPKAPYLALEMTKTVFTLGASSCIECFVMSRTLAEGPKVFAFSDALTCEALEKFALSVSYCRLTPAVPFRRDRTSC
jgi:hypothetical protein